MWVPRIRPTQQLVPTSDPNGEPGNRYNLRKRKAPEELSVNETSLPTPHLSPEPSTVRGSQVSAATDTSDGTGCCDENTDVIYGTLEEEKVELFAFCRYKEQVNTLLLLYTCYTVIL